MKKYYSVNELCHLAQISVRTLHHYDEIDILKPHHRTPKNHRRYTYDSVLRLQQISMLKFIGFSLHEIKQFFANKDYNIYDSLKMQIKYLNEQVDQIQKIIKLVSYLTAEHELKKPLDWDIVLQITNVLKNNKPNKQCWYEQFLTKPEQEVYALHGTKHMAEWKSILDEIRNNTDKDPQSTESKNLINKLIQFARQQYGNNPELITKLWQAFKAGIIDDALHPIDRKLIKFIESTNISTQLNELLMA